MSSKRNTAIIRHCETCGTTFNPYTGRESTSRFCSRACNGVGQGLARANTDWAERLWSQVHKAGKEECWPWRGWTAQKYGRMSVAGSEVGAHRLAYKWASGYLPDDMIVCHSCDNRPCCNPGHLFIGTDADNVADMDTKGRRRTVPQRGERHRRAKLTEAQVLSIRADLRPAPAVAKSLGISKSLVRGIRRRENWGWLP